VVTKRQTSPKQASAKTTTAKQLLERAVANLPEDATMDEAVDALYLALKVGRGRAEIKEGRGVSQEEVEESLEKWLA
jgi:predicted transcriptional regulator